MADSSGEDDFGSYGTTTTPFRPPTGKTTTRVTKINGNTRTREATATAGPSSQPAKPRTRKKRTPTPEPDVVTNDEASDVEAMDVEEAEVEEVETPQLPNKQGKKPASRQANVGGVKKAAAVATVARGKGKAKAEPPPRQAPATKRENTTSEVVLVDDMDGIEDIQIEVNQPGRLNGTAKTRQIQVKKKESGQESTLQKQLDRVNEKLIEAVAQRNSLASQLQEVHEVRRTEAEQAMIEQAQQYEIRLKTQEEMIQELTTQLARVDSMTQAGKTSTLHFLTREAAEEERKGLDKEVQRLRDVLREKDNVIAQKDAKIADQEKSLKILQSDLNAEVANSKTIRAQYANRDPPSSLPRNARGPVITTRTDDVKNGKVIRLYEDLTNLLVIKAKHEPSGEYGGEEYVYTCIFTHSGSGKAINFSLRSYDDMDAADQAGAPVPKVVYTPLELDREPDRDFVDGLKFLAGQFTFGANQLHVFLKTLNDSVDALFADSEEDAPMEE